MISQKNTPFTISRVFNAPRQRVWDAWTKADQLKQWFGPKGFVLFSSALDLRKDGTYVYGMRTPDGIETWGRWVFQEIEPPQRLVFTVTFWDNQKKIPMRHPWNPNWPLETFSTVTFTEESGKTKITVEWNAHNADSVAQETFNTGHGEMKQGWTGTFDQLEDFLK